MLFINVPTSSYSSCKEEMWPELPKKIKDELLGGAIEICSI